jgi:putative exosortase-associated protein (TIGR04073 family)
MKKLIIAALFLGFVTSSFADIHSPPKSKYTSTRKLSRGLANILYGWMELPVTVWRANETSQASTEIIFDGIITGIERTGNRIAYGLYEVVNFRKPLYKDTFRPPYTRMNYDPNHGYEEFPPQLGELSTLRYGRGYSW